MYQNLKVEMEARGVTMNDIAKVLKVTPEEAEARLNSHTYGEGDLTAGEAIAIRNNLFSDCTLDYLFALRVAKA